MKVTRRPALESDTEFCRVLHHRAYRDVCERQFGPWDEAMQDTFFFKDMSGGGFEIILCDGVPCGYLRVELGGDHVEIHEIVLDPDYQNRGIGSLLLRQTMELARTKSLPFRLRTLHLNRAQELYRRLGFRECGRTETHVLFEWISA